MKKDQNLSLCINIPSTSAAQEMIRYLKENL